MTTAGTDLDWILDELSDRVPEVGQAVLLSHDGLLIARSRALDKEAADQFAAMASALFGIARAAGHKFDGGPLRQAVIEYDHAVMFVAAGGANTCLALWTDPSADMERLAYEVTTTVRRVGSYLSTGSRTH
ncbi:roadblock/LC7 domain-containing protein [Nocardia sp. NPDC057227]|uniref:roadblock/LC7 domain-containing protein n=1 Tax=Nocardia sp. NPDC057227 TaxID=3346056 RepID=UPI00363CBA63